MSAGAADLVMQPWMAPGDSWNTSAARQMASMPL